MKIGWREREYKTTEWDVNEKINLRKMDKNKDKKNLQIKLKTSQPSYNLYLKKKNNYFPIKLRERKNTLG